MSETQIVAPLPEGSPRIGIVMMSAVGDAVHVLPLLTALKAHRPDARVTWVCSRARRRSCAAIAR